MKGLLRFIWFGIILVILIQAASLIFIPNISNLKEFGFYKKAKYELLDEDNDTVDVVFVGDSLFY